MMQAGLSRSSAKGESLTSNSKITKYSTTLQLENGKGHRLISRKSKCIQLSFLAITQFKSRRKFQNNYST